MQVEDIACLSSVGVVLSVAHRAAIQSSFPLLKTNYKFSSVCFLGKLTGKDGDYLLAFGVEGSLGAKKYFFCKDGVSWAQLSVPTEETKALVAKLPAALAFSGDITTETEIPAPPPAEGEEPAEPSKLTEEQRLAVVVAELDAAAASAPAGALSLTPAGVVANPTFSGLDAAGAMSVGSYVLIDQPKAKNVLADATNQAADFLATADSLVPKGALVTRNDPATGSVTVRNLLYPGAVAFCKPGTPTWGYVYSGNGEKNADIAFMLP